MKWHFVKPHYFIAFFFQSIAWIPWERTLKYVYGLEISGKSNLRKVKELRKKYKSGVLFVAKHTGELDIMLVLTAISPFSSLFPMFYLTQKTSYYTSGDFGWRQYLYGRILFYMFGAHPMGNNQHTYDALYDENKHSELLKLHTQFLKNGYSLSVFPEGKIPENGGFGDVHGAPAYMALQSGALVVPVAIKRKKNERNKEIIKLHYGEPLTPDKHLQPLEQKTKHEPNMYKKITEHIMEQVKRDLKHL